MRKILLGLLVGLLTFSSCNDEGVIQPSVEYGVYQWNLNQDLLYIFGEYKLNIKQDGVLSFDGNYKLENGVLTFWDDLGYSISQPLEVKGDGFLLEGSMEFVKIGELNTYLK